MTTRRRSSLQPRPATDPLSRLGTTGLRLSLGLVFLWFGALKLVPGLSPAEGLAGDTLSILTQGLVPPTVSVPPTNIE